MQKNELHTCKHCGETFASQGKWSAHSSLAGHMVREHGASMDLTAARKCGTTCTISAN